MDSTIRIIVDPSGTVRGTKVVNKSLKGVRSELARTDRSVKTNKASFASLGRSLIGPLSLTVGLAAVTAQMRKVIEVGATFTKTLSELSAITGATGKDLNELAEAARKFGRETTIGAAAAAEGFKLIASAKPDLLENRDALIAVTGQAITLAEAAGITLPEAAKALGGALNQFNADADEAGRFINVLAAGSQRGATEIPDLTQSLKAAGAAASSLGLSFEDTIAGIEVLGEVNIKGAEAGTQFRNVLLALKQTGIDELDPSVQGLTGALANLNSLELKSVDILKIFGRESFVAATAMLERIDRQDELTAAITGTNTAEEQAAIAQNNLSGDTVKLTNALDDLFLTIFEDIEPGLRVFVQGLTDLTGAMGGFISATKEAVALTGLASFSDVFGSDTSVDPAVPEAEVAAASPARTKRSGTIAAGKIEALRSRLGGTSTGKRGDKSDAKTAAAEIRSSTQAAEEQSRAFANIRDELQPLVAAELQLTESQGVLNEQFRLGKIDANELQKLHGLLKDEYEESITPVAELTKEQERQAELLRSIQGPTKEAMANIASLNALYEDGTITVDEFNQSLENQRLVMLDASADFGDGVERGLIRANASIGDFADETERGIARAFGGAEDVIADFVQTTRVDVSGLVDSILADLLRMSIRQAVLAPLAQAFQTGSTPSAPAGGGGNTGALANIGLGALASFGDGGIQNTPTVSNLAENGPEAIIPLKGGNVPVKISGGGGQTIVNNFNIKTQDATSFRNSQNQVLRDFGQSVQRIQARNG